MFTGWISASRAGNFSRYYQVNFGNLTIVTSVELQSLTGSSVTAVQQYMVQYSNDGINWINGETVSITGCATLTSVDIFKRIAKRKFKG
jgi:hypothetical protein